MNENRDIPTLSEAIGRKSVDFNTDLPKINKEALIGADFVVLQGKIIEDWDSEYGTSSFSLLKIRLEGGSQAGEYTTLMGGKAIVRQVAKLLKDRKLPVRVCLNKRQGGYGDYYVLQDPVSQVLAEEVVIVATPEVVEKIEAPEAES